MTSWILTITILSPVAGALLLMLPPYGDRASIRRSAVLYSLVTLGLTILALTRFYSIEEANDGAFVLMHELPWIVGESVEVVDMDGYLVEKPSIDISYRVGVDGISIWLVALTSFLMPLAILSSFTAITIAYSFCCRRVCWACSARWTCCCFTFSSSSR